MTGAHQESGEPAASAVFLIKTLSDQKCAFYSILTFVHDN